MFSETHQRARKDSAYVACSFEERLAAQRAEKAAAEKEAKQLGFKAQLSKEQKSAKKSQRLAAIGEDLLALSSDQPFRFPATFTFVVRAFSSEHQANGYLGVHLIWRTACNLIDNLAQLKRISSYTGAGAVTTRTERMTPCIRRS